MTQQIDVELTEKFSNFLHGLKDPIGKGAIVARLKRLETGVWGDAAPIGGGLTELRIHTGPGYRIYCKKVGQLIVVVLGAGTKRNQQPDIDAAKADAELL